jgi:hypothetical protein
MARKNSEARELPLHPVLAKLLATPSATAAGDIIKLQGYLGPGMDADHIRLYPGLDDLSENIEVARADILEHADAPASVFPYGGKSVWLRRSASVVYNRTQQVKTQAEFLAGAIRRVHLSAQMSPPRTAVVIDAPDTNVLACNPSRTCANTCANTCAATCQTCETHCNQTCVTCQTCQTQCGQQTCVAPPGGVLGGSINYVLGANDGGNCAPLTNFGVMIEVLQDIALDPSSSTKGFSFQLNGYSPGGPNQPLSQYQQYVIEVDTSGGNAVLWGSINSYQADGETQIINYPNPIPPAQRLTTFDEPKIPAGWNMEIRLWNDSAGNVNSVSFTISDPDGQLQGDQEINLLGLPLASGTGSVGQSDLAPVVAFEVDLVGPYDGLPAQFTSGSGLFTYFASNVMTVLTGMPDCVGTPDIATLETGNSDYGTMSCTPSQSFDQTYSVVPGGTPQVRRPGRLVARKRHPRKD